MHKSNETPCEFWKVKTLIDYHVNWEYNVFSVSDAAPKPANPWTNAPNFKWRTSATGSSKWWQFTFDHSFQQFGGRSSTEMWLWVFAFCFLSRKWIREEEGKFSNVPLLRLLGALLSEGCYIPTELKKNSPFVIVQIIPIKDLNIQGHFHEYFKLAISWLCCSGKM